jgi:PIN domain nuclease of toxin-antitoxin system
VILLDTHVLIWLAGDPARLSRPAVSAIRRAEATASLAIASITLWEMALIAWRGRIRFRGTLEEWIRSILGDSGVAIRELTPEIAVLATQFPESFPSDPADRQIAATARYENLALVTADTEIQASPLVKTIW